MAVRVNTEDRVTYAVRASIEVVGIINSLSDSTAALEFSDRVRGILEASGLSVEMSPDVDVDDVRKALTLKSIDASRTTPASRIQDEGQSS